MIEAPTPAQAVKPAEAAARRDIFDDIWSLFTSTKLALGLILAIAAACLAGALVAQVPSEMLQSSDATRTWVERMRPKYGSFTDAFAAAGLFWIFQTAWFRALLGALTINTFVCTLNRLPNIWRQVFGAPVWPADGLYERGEPRQTVRLAAQPLEAAVRPVGRALRGRRFRVVENAQPTVTYLYADRFRLARFGTVFTHTALLLVFSAAVVSGPLGYFEEPGFAVPIGATRDVGHATGLTVRADDFADEYDAAGRPKDYRSELVVFENGRQVAAQTVRVNEPLIYNGVRFHQAYYGQSAIVSVTDPTGNQVYRDAVALTWRSNDGQRPVGYFAVPGSDLQVYLVGPAGEGDQIVRPGELLVEAYRAGSTSPNYRLTLTQRRPLALAGLQIQFEREIPFTGLRVVRDPGAMIVWVASALLILGLVLAFYFPHRRLWARLRRLPDGVELTLTGAGREMAPELRRLAEQLGPVAPAEPAPEAHPVGADRVATRRASTRPVDRAPRGSSRGR